MARVMQGPHSCALSQRGRADPPPHLPDPPGAAAAAGPGSGGGRAGPRARGVVLPGRVRREPGRKRPQPRARSPLPGGSSEAVTARPAVCPRRTQRGGGGSGEGRRIQKEKREAGPAGGKAKKMEKGRQEAEAGGRGRRRARRGGAGRAGARAGGRGPRGLWVAAARGRRREPCGSV